MNGIRLRVLSGTLPAYEEERVVLGLVEKSSHRGVVQFDAVPTELKALEKLSGQNFGEDIVAWLQWWKSQSN